MLQGATPCADDLGMRSLFRRAALIVAFVTAFVPSIAAEDVIVLKSGRELRGVVIDETDERVRVRIEGGSLWYPRDRIREIRRDVDADTAAAADQARTEHFLLYSDGRRVGTRVLRYTPRKNGHQWESHVVFLGEHGMPVLDLRTIERSDRDYRPVLFQIQETPTDAIPRLIRGEVIGSRLEIGVTAAGETEKTLMDVKPGARFPLAAQAEFSKTLADVDQAGPDDVGSATATKPVPVFLPYIRRWRQVTFRNAGSRVVEAAGAGLRVRLIERRCDALREMVWVDSRGNTRLADINGASLRALAAPVSVVVAVAGGEPDRVTGTDSAARTVFRDPVLGFSIRKPDPSWLFEEPASAGGAALLVVRNRPMSASIDVIRDEAPSAGVTLKQAGAALERLLRAHSRDLEVVRQGIRKGGDGAYYELEVRATTKGERTATLAHVYVSDRGVYRLLAACPAARFDLVRDELEEVLLSFRIDA